MNDARWYEVFQALESSGKHFRNAERIFEEGNFDDGFAGYKQMMALLHAMQIGHTALEKGLLVVLQILEEHPPTGPDWHAALIARCGSEMPGNRPAILSPSARLAALETKNFRSLAVHGYEIRFEPVRAKIAVQAGRLLAETATSDVEAFRKRLSGRSGTR